MVACNYRCGFDGSAADPTGVMVIRPNTRNSNFAAGVLENIMKFAQNVPSCTTPADVFRYIKFVVTDPAARVDYEHR